VFPCRMKASSSMNRSKQDIISSIDKTKVFIVDDHPIVREGLAKLINQEVDLVVCGEADGLATAMKGISVHKPAVVIVDIKLKDSDGIELTKRIRSCHVNLPVIVLSVYDESMYAQRALSAGAQAYVMKESVAVDIVTAIRTVLRGEIYVSQNFTRQLLQKATGKSGATGRTSVDDLSDRELEIFRLIGQGYKTSEIAGNLHLSTKTIETYHGRIKGKLGLADAGELTRYAIKWASSQNHKY